MVPLSSGSSVTGYCVIRTGLTLAPVVSKFYYETSAEFLALPMHRENGNPIPQPHNQMAAFSGTEPASFRFEEAFKLRTTHISKIQHGCCIYNISVEASGKDLSAIAGQTCDT
jgi:hypothetical protein